MSERTGKVTVAAFFLRFLGFSFGYIALPSSIMTINSITITESAPKPTGFWNKQRCEATLMSIRQILFFGFCMSLIMSMCMAFVMTAINVGFGDIFVSAWMKGWGVGFVVSLPLSFFLPSFLQKTMQRLKI
jgi:hypothetical protein